MSDHPPLAPPSAAEVADFRSLGLTPGNWAALAPVPLLNPGLRTARPDEFDLFRELAALVPGTAGGEPDAAEFWTRYSQFRLPACALALLGWHLAKRVPRPEREAYLRALADAAGRFFSNAILRPDVVRDVREAVEAALGHGEYRPHLAPPVVPPPDPEVVRRWTDAALADEAHIRVIDGALALVARRLASFPFDVRYDILEGPGKRLVPEWVDRVRAMTEEILGGVEPMTEPEPAPAPGASEPPPPPAATAAESVPLTLDEALARARRTTVSRVRDWLTTPGHGDSLLFDAFRTECPEVAVVRDPAAVPDPLWVIGDVHGDVLALANLVAHAERESTTPAGPAFLFLGDFVDRGRFDHDTLLLIFGLAMKYPGRVCVVPGNHDSDLRWSEKAEKFAVSIEPAEYCDRLNGLLGSENERDREQVELARLAIEFWKARPKAVFLPDGTMFAHGGFPHTDLQTSLRGVAQLGEPGAVSDFQWARLSESPKKRPNRGGGRGHEFGWRDFAQFCQVMTDVVGVPVRRLVRGHDHVAARWDAPADYEGNGVPVLTVNAMGWRMDGEPEPPHGPHPFPVVARHVPDHLPAVVRVPLDPAEVDRARVHEEPADAGFGSADFFGSVAIEPQAPPPRTSRMTDAELEGGV